MSPMLQRPMLVHIVVPISPRSVSSGESTTTRVQRVPCRCAQRATRQPILLSTASFVVAADVGIVRCVSKNTRRVLDTVSIEEGWRWRIMHSMCSHHASYMELADHIMAHSLIIRCSSSLRLTTTRTYVLASRLHVVLLRCQNWYV